MKQLKDIIAQVKSGPADVVSADISNTGIKLVHMKKGNDGISVIGADILPPSTFSEENPEELEPLELPPKLKGHYMSIAVSGEDSIVKLLSFPGAFQESSINKVIDSIGLEDISEHRIAYKIIVEGRGKSESRVLAVAVPDKHAKIGPMLFPVGRPAPFSLELSGLAAMTAFMKGPGTEYKDKAVGIMDFGDDASTFALFNKGDLALIRRFDIGTNTILDKVQETLGVDQETAQGIITDGAFDISQPVSEVMEPLVKQLIVSRDFVERREDCSVASIYASGGLVVSRDSLEEMRSAMGLEVKTWNPFDGLNVAANAIPENLNGQEWRFTAAVGACLATFDEE
jgi:Tfp pilus assembly PilM family ATPase